jgi:single-strand DNA-binding protein
MNNAILCGNLGSDWEILQSQYGIVAKNSIAITKKYTPKDSNTQVTRTQWLKLVAFNKQGEILAQYTKKGDKLLVRGEIQTNDYENSQGETKTSVNIKIEEFTLLGSKNQEEKETNFNNYSDGNIEQMYEDVFLEQSNNYTQAYQNKNNKQHNITKNNQQNSNKTQGQGNWNNQTQVQNSQTNGNTSNFNNIQSQHQNIGQTDNEKKRS